MRKTNLAAAVLACLLIAWSLPAAAYIGPGAGITMLGALWGVIVAVAVAVGAVLYYPIRVLLRRRRTPGTTAQVARDRSV